jgi:hypothetical protein
MRPAFSSDSARVDNRYGTGWRMVQPLMGALSCCSQLFGLLSKLSERSFTYRSRGMRIPPTALGIEVAPVDGVQNLATRASSGLSELIKQNAGQGGQAENHRR